MVNPKTYELAEHFLADCVMVTKNQKMLLAEQLQVVCEDFVRDLAETDEAEWKGGVLILYPEYYNDSSRVHGALMLTDVVVTPGQVEAWSPEQRKVAAEWALSTHFAAADNDDVIVPPRPEFLL